MKGKVRLNGKGNFLVAVVFEILSRHDAHTYIYTYIEMSIFAIAYQGTCQRQLQTGTFAVCSRLGEVRKKISKYIHV